MLGMREVVNQQSLRYSVSKAIFCPGCQTILDVSRAVEITAEKGGKIAFCKPFCIECYDKRLKAGLDGVAEVHGLTITVIDGREYDWKGF